MYSPEFKKVRTFSYTGREPKKLSVCRTTGKVALCFYGGVLVLDSNWTELYRYKGPPGQASETTDVVFDRHGYLLVADMRHYPKGGVQIVNADTGKHMQTIELEYEFGNFYNLSITHEGHVVVGTWKADCNSPLTNKL